MAGSWLNGVHGVKLFYLAKLVCLLYVALVPEPYHEAVDSCNIIIIALYKNQSFEGS